jgi:hypothetical protein
MTHPGEQNPDQYPLTDEELALQSVDRELPSAQADLASAVRWADVVNGPNYSPYRPTHPGPQPHPEAGGMDHEDWRVAMAEYHEDLDNEGRDPREDADYDVSKYASEVDRLTDYRNRVAEGDTGLIARLAQAERARLDEEARQAALREIRNGKEMPLAQEVHDEAARTVDVIVGARLQPGTEAGPNGWSYTARAQNRDQSKGALPYGHVFERNPGQGTFGAYTDRIIIAGQSYDPNNLTDGVTVQHFELPEAVGAVTSPVSEQVLLSDGEVESYTVRLDGQGGIRQSEYRRGVVMDDRRPKTFTYEAGETGITSLYMSRADYKGDASLIVTEGHVAHLHDLMSGLADDITGMGRAAGYDPDAPKPPEPPAHLDDVFDETREAVRQSGRQDLIEFTYDNGQGTTEISSAAEVGTRVEQRVNHHGGHRNLGTVAMRTNAEGVTTAYDVRVSTTSWGQRLSGSLAGELTVSKRDANGNEIYRFSTRRPGAAEAMTRLALRHISDSLPRQEQDS